MPASFLVGAAPEWVAVPECVEPCDMVPPCCIVLGVPAGEVELEPAGAGAGAEGERDWFSGAAVVSFGVCDGAFWPF